MITAQVNFFSGHFLDHQFTLQGTRDNLFVSASYYELTFCDMQAQKPLRKAFFLPLGPGTNSPIFSFVMFYSFAWPGVDLVIKTYMLDLASKSVWP